MQISKQTRSTPPIHASNHMAAMPHAFLPILLIYGCGSTVDWTYIQDCTACNCNKIAFQSPSSNSSAPLTSEVTLSILLSAPVETTASMLIYWSRDGNEWNKITSTGNLDNLTVTPQGTSHQVVWSTIMDVGYTKSDDLMLRANATSSCGDWSTHEITGIDIDNSQHSPIGCAVTVKQPDAAIDGPTKINFELLSPDSAYVNVRSSYSVDGGTTFQPITVAIADCDSDGSLDRLEDLPTAPLGTDYCLTWETESDITTDETAILKLECESTTSNTLPATSESEPFLVMNSSIPDPKEIVVTEVLSDAWKTYGTYIELHNRTNHTLNINGLLIEIWNRGVNPDTSDARGQHEINASSGMISIPGQGLAVVSAEDNPVDNGCLSADDSWGENIDNLDGVEHIRLSFNNKVISELSLTQSGFPSEKRGTAIGADPILWSSDAVGDAASWCYQSSTISACEGVDEIDLSIGTPGDANNGC